MHRHLGDFGTVTYAEYVAALQFLAVMQDANGQALLNQILPQVISYSELRLYRNPLLDFLAARTTDTTQITTRGIRSVPIPPQIVVVEEVSLLLPANTRPTAALGVPAGMQRVPLLRTTQPWLDLTWPTESLVQAPVPFETYYALFSEEETTVGDDPIPGASSFLIGPTVDDAYYVEVNGTFRPAPLSEANPQTFISIYLPDLMISTSMVWICGMQKNFGAAADDPRSALYWEAIVREQLQSSQVEEARKKSLSVGSSSYAPTPLAGMLRTGPAGPPQQPTPGG
jgi:hypothetical protein